VETLGAYYSLSLGSTLYPECGNPRGISVSQCRVPPEEWGVLEVSTAKRGAKECLLPELLRSKGILKPKN